MACGLIAMRNATNIHDCGTHSPGRCLANNQVDDTRLLLGFVRVRVGQYRRLRQGSTLVRTMIEKVSLSQGGSGVDSIRVLPLSMGENKVVPSPNSLILTRPVHLAVGVG